MMHVYNCSAANTSDDIANGITVRADLHLLLDSFAFVLTPKNDGFVTHMLHKFQHYAYLHRTPASHHDRVRVQFLYTRFAYNIIHEAKDTGSNIRWNMVPLPRWAVLSIPQRICNREGVTGTASEQSIHGAEYDEQGN